MITSHDTPTIGAGRSLLTAEQVAELTGYSPRTVRALARQGVLRGLRPTAHTWRFRAEDVEAWLAGGAS